MKYKYKFSEIQYKSGKKSLVIEVEDKIKLVATFLMSDIQKSNPDYVYEAIDKVLSGESDFEELNGNVCCVEIMREKSKVYNNLAPDGMGNWCEIETDELKELVRIWHEKVRNYRII